MSAEITSLVFLLSNQFLKTVFKEVAKNRSMFFKDLQESMLKTSEVQRADTHPSSADRRQLEDAVQKLKEADLIKERPASIEDFNRYSVTANGLMAERQLRLAESTTAQP
jgi:hypothetical protein